MALLFTAPAAVFDYFTHGQSFGTPGQPFSKFTEAGYYGFFFSETAIDAIFFTLFQATVVFGTYQEMRGRHEPVGTCLRRGLVLYPHLVAVAVIVAVIQDIAVAALVIPAFVVAALLFVVVPALVVEELGVWPSFKRSFELTRGVWGRIMGLIFIMLVPLVAASFAIGWLAVIFELPVLEIIFDWIADALFDAALAVATAVIYYELVFIREGKSIDEVAAIFD